MRSFRMPLRAATAAFLLVTTLLAAPGALAAPSSRTGTASLGADAAALAQTPLSEVVPAAAALGGYRVEASPVMTGAVIDALRSAVADAGTAARTAITITEAPSKALELSRAYPGGARLPARPDGVAVDRQALAQATATLVSTVEAALPQLRRFAATLPATAPAGDGCDVLDVPGAVCVAGLGANTLTADYPLVVDLGGDDTHLHSAGAADPLGNGLVAAVTVDLAGNDAYRTAVPTSAGARAAQGAGLLGGVGVLVDASGDDVYEAFASDPESAGGQGQGIASIGAGVLADLDGTDSYGLASAGPTNLTGGWGLGVAGIGLHIDHGDDDDTYEATASPDIPAGSHASPSVLAGGVGLFGWGVSADDGGRDTFDLRSGASDPVPATSINSFQVTGLGVGGGYGGVGVHATGSGTTTRTLTVDAPAGARFASVHGLGWGTLAGGVGIAADIGGADTYITGVTTAADSTVTAPFVTLNGMGTATGGIGVLYDGRGDDGYRATADVPAAADNTVRVAALGAADLGAQGAVDDHAGNDRYQVDVSALGGTSASNTVIVAALGAHTIGSGSLRDLRGSDSYRVAVATDSALNLYALADGPEEFVAGTSGVSAFADIDGGAPDSVSLDPQPEPACVGTRGVGTWVDCSGSVGTMQ